MLKRPTASIAAAVLAYWALTAAAAQVPQGQRPAAAGRGRGAPAPVTRIVTFEAEPATIKPGGSALLIWHIENPPSPTGFNGFGTIEPGVGRVAPRGSQRVAPAATTTYTLTAGTVTKSVTVTVPGTVPVAAASSAAAGASTDIPRTPEGKPDFSGIFGWGNLFGGRGGGAAPALKPGAEKYRVTRGALDTGATSDCLPLIPPNSFGVPYEFQFVQNRNYLVILHEYPGTFRIIPLDGEPHQVDPDPSWLGDSVGRWDGDTLVIDTIGYNDKTEISGYRHTEALHTVERLRRVPGGVEYELTIEDPNVFAAPWTVNRSFRFVEARQKRIFEFVCENNRDYRVLFGERK
ncbi:MAG: hypothetical protein ACRD3G_00650 [Vicinamibacterales bacterium]